MKNMSPCSNKFTKAGLRLCLAASLLTLTACGGGGGGSGPDPQPKKAKFTIHNLTTLKNSSLYTSSEGIKLSITGTAGCSLSSTSVSTTAPVTATIDKASGSCILKITPESGSSKTCSSDKITHDGLLTPTILAKLNTCLHTYSIDDSVGSKKDVLNLKSMPGTVGFFNIHNQTKSSSFSVGGGECFASKTLISAAQSTKLNFKKIKATSCNATFEFGTDSCTANITAIDTANPMLDVKALQQYDAYKTWAKAASDIDSWTSVAKYSTSPLRYRGVSLAGGAFDGANHAATGNNDFGLLPIKEDANLFVAKGANTFRVPIAMEYATEIDDPSKGPYKHTSDFSFSSSNNNYWTTLKKTITDLTTKGAYVIVDLHNYGHFNSGSPGTDPTDLKLNTIIGGSYGGDTPTADQFGTFWAQVVKNLDPTNSNDHLMFELMNEPENVPNSVIELDYQMAIQDIRKQENSKLHHAIILDGNGWSGLHYWNAQNTRTIIGREKSGGCNNLTTLTSGAICDKDWLQELIKSYKSTAGEPLMPLMIDVHQYVDKDFSGTHSASIDCEKNDNNPIDTTHGDKLETAMNKWFDHLNSFLDDNIHRVNGEKIPYILGEFGSYYDGENNQCTISMHNLLSAVKKSTADGYLWWSAGHGFNSDYPLNIGPGACYGNQFMYSDIMSEKPFVVQADKSTWEDNFKPKTVKIIPGGVEFNQLLPDETVGINTFTLSLANPEALKTPAYNVYDAVPAHGYSSGYPIDYSKPTCRTLNATNNWTQKLPVPTDQDQKVQYGLFKAKNIQGKDDKFMDQLYDLGFAKTYGYASKINNPQFTVSNSAKGSGVKSEDMVTIAINP